MEGAFTAVFEKLTKINTKQGFALAILVGDVFADPTYASAEDDEAVLRLVQGKIEVPIPTYFTIGKQPLPQKILEKLQQSEDELCDNLHFLSKRSITKTSEGLRIVNLAGTLDPEVIVGVSKDAYLPFHTEGDAKALNGANSADILLTTSWPASVRTGSKVEVRDDAVIPNGEQCIADLCLALKPRYHFSSSPSCFFEREPFFHLRQDGQPEISLMTRFISLSSYQDPSKQKWLYAFSITPNALAPTPLPVGVTAPPFTTSSARKRQREDNDLSNAYSRYATNGNDHHPTKYHRGRGKAGRHNLPRRPPGPQECFFCLSNPNLSTHLITSIGTEAYLTIAKGPVVDTNTFPTLPLPMHILIIPLAHHPTFSLIPDPNSRGAAYREMQRYRRALHSLLMSKCKDGMGAVTWEISRQEGVHIHWQFIPIPIDLVKRGVVEAAFKVEAENLEYPTFKSKEIGDGVSLKSDYFRVWIWRPEDGETGSLLATDRAADDEGGSSSRDSNTRNGGGASPTKETRGKEKELVMALPAPNEQPNFRFDLQFGRRVMAKLLRLEQRLDWRDSVQSVEDETRDAEAFKTAFKGFDFSLEED